MKRKNFYALGTLLLMLSLVVSACSSGDNSTSGSSNSNKPPAKEVALKFWIFENAPMVEETKKLITEYEDAHPGTTIDLQVFPNNQYNDKLLVALGTHTGPDVMLSSDRNIPTLTAKGLLAPADSKDFGFDSLDAMKAGWLEGSLNGLVQDNNLYGVPMEFNTFSLFINKKAFEQAGLDPVKDAPKTWDELRETAKKLTIRSGGQLQQAGFAWPMFNGNYDVLLMDPMVRQLGGSLIEDNGKKAYLNDAKVKQVLEYWKDLYEKDKVTDIGFGTSTAAAPMQSFIDGKVAMWLSGPWAIPQITEGTAAYDNYVVAPLPQYNPDKPVSMLYSWNWTVSKDSANASEAWAFVNFLSGKQSEWLTSSGYIQPRIGWEDSEEFKQFPYSQVWSDQMKYGSYVIRSSTYPQVSDVVGRMVDSVMKGSLAVDKALETAQGDATKALNP